MAMLRRLHGKHAHGYSLGNDQIIYSTKSYLSGVYVSPDGAFNFANATLAQ